MLATPIKIILLLAGNFVTESAPAPTFLNINFYFFSSFFIILSKSESIF